MKRFFSNISEFPQSYSCINEILEIGHEINQSFDANTTLETHGVFLDMRKVFLQSMASRFNFQFKFKVPYYHSLDLAHS